jgi:cytochrome b561
MALANTATRWGAIAKLFHWTSAVLVLGLIGLGLYMVHGTADLMQKFVLYQWHKSFGITVYGLTLARLVWRATQRSPLPPKTLSMAERTLAAGAHLLLYAGLIALPVTGFLMSAASPLGIPTVWFGLVTIPHPLDPDPVLFERLRLAHQLIAWALALLLVGHVGAALRHHLIKRDDVLRRMLPGG